MNKTRHLTSLFTAISFLILSVTGLMSYIIRRSDIVATVHTIFGMLFIIGIAIHIRNNWKSLKSYIINKKA